MTAFPCCGVIAEPYAELWGGQTWHLDANVSMHLGVYACACSSRRGVSSWQAGNYLTRVGGNGSVLDFNIHQAANQDVACLQRQIADTNGRSCVRSQTSRLQAALMLHHVSLVVIDSQHTAAAGTEHFVAPRPLCASSVCLVLLSARLFPNASHVHAIVLHRCYGCWAATLQLQPV